MENTRNPPTLHEIIQMLLNEVSTLKRRIDEIEARNPDPAKPPSEWMNRDEAAKLVNRSWATLGKWRHEPRRGLIEGIHWQNDGGAVVYHREALTHWYNHRSDPAAHTDWLVARAEKTNRKSKR